MIYDIIVIGGGASGLMFASKIKVKNALILEGSHSIGTKLLMSGGGHCNITHSGSIKDFVSCYGESGKRVRSCLYKHSNLELVDMLENNGVPTITNEEGRVFPASMKARDVLDMLKNLAEANGFEIRTDAKVVGISFDELSGTYSLTIADGTVIKARTVVVATGGITYPKTGSDGSMFRALRTLGLNITKLHSVLAPLALIDYPYAELAGITLSNVSIQIGMSKKNRHISDSSMLFAHDSITGPAVLNISRYAEPGTEISINYIPNCEEPLDTLNNAIASSHADYSTIIADTFGLPKRFAQLVVSRASNSTKINSSSTAKASNQSSNNSTRKATASRDGISSKRVIELLTADRFIAESRGGNGMVTSGGVALSEINTATMQAKSFPNLYIIGEALDVDGITGGYNLQFAYSSASAAADSVAESLSD